MPNASLDRFSQIQIVKTGRHETFVDDSGEQVSLGDVIRSTTLLRCFSPSQKIVWHTSREAAPLVSGKFVERVNLLSAPSQISDDGLIINLEKIEMQRLSRAEVVGFVRKDDRWLIRDLHDRHFSVSEWKAHCAEQGASSWGAALQKLLNSRADKTYGLFPRPDVKIESDIGLNWNVGGKWPSKAASEAVWRRVESLFSPKYTISWQRGLNSLEEYAQWLASNRLIISLDSLGLHLAMAMEVPSVGLFGATDHAFFDRSHYAELLNFDVPRESHACLPCWQKTCHQKVHCSEYLPQHQLKFAVERFLT